MRNMNRINKRISLLGVEVSGKERKRFFKAVDSSLALIVDEFGMATKFLKVRDGRERRHTAFARLFLVRF